MGLLLFVSTVEVDAFCWQDSSSRCLAENLNIPNKLSTGLRSGVGFWKNRACSLLSDLVVSCGRPSRIVLQNRCPRTVWMSIQSLKMKP